MKVEEIISIIEALAKNNLTDFSLEQKEFVLKIGKKQVPESKLVENKTTLKEITELEEEPVLAGVETGRKEIDKNNLIKVTSPMVGTFYQAPSPDSLPFVKVGDSVEKGDVLCIIEAMKLMNEIEANESGKIIEVLVENGELVEYGQTLFLVEPI